jgi:hypothetical protein
MDQRNGLSDRPMLDQRTEGGQRGLIAPENTVSPKKNRTAGGLKTQNAETSAKTALSRILAQSRKSVVSVSRMPVYSVNTREVARWLSGPKLLAPLYFAGNPGSYCVMKFACPESHSRSAQVNGPDSAGDGGDGDGDGAAAAGSGPVVCAPAQLTNHIAAMTAIRFNPIVLREAPCRMITIAFQLWKRHSRILL